MWALRGILIGFAVLLLAAIYWWGRRSDRQRRARSNPQRTAATGPAVGVPAVVLEESVSPPALRFEPTLDEPAAAAAATPAQPELEQSSGQGTPTTKIIALRLLATTPRFSGAHLRTALESESLAFGRYQIFHRLSADGTAVFSVASMLEPGSFDLEQMFHEQYPGIALFAQLPGPLDGMSVLGELIGCARRLQQTLGGILQDEQGTPLLAFRIEQLRREVREFEAAVRQSRPRSELSQP